MRVFGGGGEKIRRPASLERVVPVLELPCCRGTPRGATEAPVWRRVIPLSPRGAVSCTEGIDWGRCAFPLPGPQSRRSLVPRRSLLCGWCWCWCCLLFIAGRDGVVGWKRGEWTGPCVRRGCLTRGSQTARGRERCSFTNCGGWLRWMFRRRGALPPRPMTQAPATEGQYWRGRQ